VLGQPHRPRRIHEVPVVAEVEASAEHRQIDGAEQQRDQPGGAVAGGRGRAHVGRLLGRRRRACQSRPGAESPRVGNRLGWRGRRRRISRKSPEILQGAFKHARGGGRTSPVTGAGMVPAIGLHPNPAAGFRRRI
jgi:hypothetical protein